MNTVRPEHNWDGHKDWTAKYTHMYAKQYTTYTYLPMLLYMKSLTKNTLFPLNEHLPVRWSPAKIEFWKRKQLMQPWWKLPECRVIPSPLSHSVFPSHTFYLLSGADRELQASLFNEAADPLRGPPQNRGGLEEHGPIDHRPKCSTSEDIWGGHLRMYLWCWNKCDIRWWKDKDNTRGHEETQQGKKPKDIVRSNVKEWEDKLRTNAAVWVTVINSC